MSTYFYSNPLPSYRLIAAYTLRSDILNTVSMGIYS
jgi:hypothetical protein